MSDEIGKWELLRFGNMVAVAISFSAHKSILWAIVHGALGWLYVIYYALFTS